MTSLIRRIRITTMVAAALTIVTTSVSNAQTIGPFSWQLQPYCNVIALTATPHGPFFTLDGVDTQCGAGRAGSVVGMAFFNPDGSIGLGMTTVTTPGGTAIHVDATIDLATLSGTWRDSAGNSGAFAFGGAAGGSPRPVPAGGIPPASITTAQIAPGSITSTLLAPGSVGAAALAPGVIGTVAQTRVTGACANGQAFRGINTDGSVMCTNLATEVDNPAFAATSAVGAYASSTIGADGLPIFAYQAANNSLRVLHCGNAACSAGNIATTVDNLPGTSVGVFTSIAIGVDGLPIISHGDLVAGALRVTHCGNAECTAGNASLTIDDPTDVVGSFSSIAIGSDGLPVISHYNQNKNALRITHCGTATCSSGNASVDADDDAVLGFGLFTSIAIGGDGLPVVAHQNIGAGALRITHCGNVTCSAGNVSTDVDDPAENVGSGNAIAIGADGLPIVGHQMLAPTWGTRVTRCGNVSCTAGNTSTTVDDVPGNSIGVDVAIAASGFPIVSHGTTTGSLRLTFCGNAACTTSTSANVDGPPPLGGIGTTIAVGADGLPVASHWASGPNVVRVVKCGTATCQ